MTAVWVYPALEVQDRPELKNKRNSTTPSRTIRVLMIKTVGLPIVRLNRCTFPCRSDQTVSGISTSRSLQISSTAFKLSDRDILFHFLCLSQSVLSNSDRHMQSYLHQIHFFCLRKCPNQLQPCVAQPTVKSHWSKILLHTCKTWFCI